MTTTAEDLYKHLCVKVGDAVVGSSTTSVPGIVGRVHDAAAALDGSEVLAIADTVEELLGETAG